ncbi:PIG-L deacetylase family protein [Wenjunlia tyrosinilytica]|nr:PIG-L family deacetylase [Wenjunlia tyrosinilytica]
MDPRTMPDTASRQSGGTVVAVSPHADDAEYGAGALLSGYAQAGWPVVIALMTGSSHGRVREAADAAQVLGARLVVDESGQDGALEVTSARVRWLEGIVGGAHLVLAPHPDDTHQDHRAAAAITWSAVRRSAVNLAWYRTPSSGPGFTATVFGPITPSQAQARARAVAMHRSQSDRPYLTAEHLAAKDAWHGWLSGCEAAEPFEAARHLLAPGPLPVSAPIVEMAQRDVTPMPMTLGKV